MEPYCGETQEAIRHRLTAEKKRVGSVFKASPDVKPEMYWKIWLGRAWADTVVFLKARLIYQASMIISAAIVGWYRGDEPNKFLNPIVYAAGAFAVTSIAVFVYNFLAAPGRIHSDQQKEIRSLSELVKPALRVHFSEDDNTFFYESQWFHELEDLFNQQSARGLKYLRLCRIALINSSKAISAENVEVRLTSISPLPKELRGKLPLPLHFMNDNIQPYKQSKNLNPNATEYVDVIGWILDRQFKKSTFYVYHCVNDIDAQFPVGDYIITIEASAKNMICKPISLYIGMRNRDGKAFKLWMSERDLEPRPENTDEPI